MKARFNHNFILLFIIALLVSCSSLSDQAEKHISKNDWVKAVVEYRRLAAENPSKKEFSLRLRQVETLAAQYYYQEGVKLLEQNDLDGAKSMFDKGLLSYPNHEKLAQIQAETIALQEAEFLFNEGIKFLETGKQDAAIDTFFRALDIYPTHRKSKEILLNLESLKKNFDDKVSTNTDAPITLNFRNTEVKTAFEFIAKSFGINVVFDEGIKGEPISIFAKDVTFDQAMNFLLSATKTFQKKVGPNTILIAPDTSAKREQYEDQLVHTYQLNSIPAEHMLGMIKSIFRVNKATINTQMNTITIRETPVTHRLIEKLIDLNDRKPAELIVEVEIIEVNQLEAEQIGIDYGSQLTATYGSSPLSMKDVKSAIKGGTVTLPATTLRYFKQEVNAKTLARPKIRVVHGKTAKIHIGDRVPLRAATVTEATGQIRTTYNYVEIGIKLQVVPEVHLDNSVSLNLGLEVSKLGQNMGTPEDPAFSIGTRNAETVMRLRDGETAILGGLIRDDDRESTVILPGLGDIPTVGNPFNSVDNSNEKTDILLTLTPRIVRNWTLPHPDQLEYFSGTSTNYADQVNYETTRKKGPASEISMSAWQPRTEPALKPETKSAERERETLSFGQTTFQGKVDDLIPVDLVGLNLIQPGKIIIDVMYNKEILHIEKMENSPNSNLKLTKLETEDGQKLIIEIQKVISSKEVLAILQMRAKGTGISYLLIKNFEYLDEKGQRRNLNVIPARVKVTN